MKILNGITICPSLGNIIYGGFDLCSTAARCTPTEASRNDTCCKSAADVEHWTPDTDAERACLKPYPLFPSYVVQHFNLNIPTARMVMEHHETGFRAPAAPYGNRRSALSSYWKLTNAVIMSINLAAAICAMASERILLIVLTTVQSMLMIVMIEGSMSGRAQQLQNHLVVGVSAVSESCRVGQASGGEEKLGSKPCFEGGVLPQLCCWRKSWNYFVENRNAGRRD